MGIPMSHQCPHVPLLSKDTQCWVSRGCYSPRGVFEVTPSADTLHPQNSMNLPPDKMKLLNQYDNEKKWELICDQVRSKLTASPVLSLSPSATRGINLAVPSTDVHLITDTTPY